MIPFEDDHNGILLEIEQLGEKFDFLIGAFNSSQILFFASCKQLGTYNVCVALPRSHPLAKKKKLSITDLYNEKLLCVSSGDCLNIDDFRKNLELQEKSMATIEKYIRDVEAFSIYAKSKVITKETVIAYKNYLQEKYAVVFTINCFLLNLGSK